MKCKNCYWHRFLIKEYETLRHTYPEWGPSYTEKWMREESYCAAMPEEVEREGEHEACSLFRKKEIENE